MEGDETTSFSAILPEHAFAPGFNDVTLMAVTGPIESPEVKRIELDGQQEFHLEPARSGEPGHLVDGDGRTWEIDRRAESSPVTSRQLIGIQTKP